VIGWEDYTLCKSPNWTDGCLFPDDSPPLDTASRLLSSGLGVRLLSNSIEQMCATRLSICRDLLIFVVMMQNIEQVTIQTARGHTRSLAASCFSKCLLVQCLVRQFVDKYRGVTIPTESSTNTCALQLTDHTLNLILTLTLTLLLNSTQ